MEATELKNFYRSVFDVHWYLWVKLSAKIGGVHSKSEIAPAPSRFVLWGLLLNPLDQYAVLEVVLVLTLTAGLRDVNLSKWGNLVTFFCSTQDSEWWKNDFSTGWCKINRQVKHHLILMWLQERRPFGEIPKDDLLTLHQKEAVVYFSSGQLRFTVGLTCLYVSLKRMRGRFLQRQRGLLRREKSMENVHSNTSYQTEL